MIGSSYNNTSSQKIYFYNLKLITQKLIKPSSSIRERECSIIIDSTEALDTLDIFCFRIRLHMWVFGVTIS